MLKLTVFADLHYKKKMYASTVEHLRTIFDRANAHGSEIVLSLGDFCNDFRGSPEIVNEFLNNSYGLPVYNVYGNHELETMGNVMELVTPLLTNRPVNWGDQVCDGSVGYYWFDTDEYRFIALDTNYSYNPDTKEWEHNREGSWGPPGYAGIEGNNLYPNSLGPVQLEWLSDILHRSAEEKKSCILLSHAVLTARIAAHIHEVRAVERLIDEVNAICPGTVIMCMNGHRHTDTFLVRNNVVYFDVNVVLSGAWKENKEFHYLDGQGFEFTDYDENGNKLSVEHMDYNSLRQGSNTWFFDAPLSANITLDGSRLTIEGSSCGWAFDIAPDLDVFNDDTASSIATMISSHTYIFSDGGEKKC